MEDGGGSRNGLFLQEKLRPDPGSSDGKASACSVEDPGSIPGSEKSPGEGNCSPLQYSCLGNPMDRGAWQAPVHGLAKELYTI